MSNSKKAQSVVIIICYYGKTPWYFPFFIKSCRYNPDVSFLLVTDMRFDFDCPSNLIVLRKSIPEFRELARIKLGFVVNELNDPFKFNDFKPAYGAIFHDLIESYDFWGYGDIDLIYGDIRSFITDTMLRTYNVIAVRSDFVTGYFSLISNSEQGRNLFTQSRDFKRILTESVYYGFDECNWNWGKLSNGESIFEINSDIQCMTYVVKKLSNEKVIKAYFGKIALEGMPGDLEWNRGRLTHRFSHAILLYHFIEFKNRPFKFIPSWKKIPDHFFIEEFYITKLNPRSVRGKLLKSALSAIQILVVLVKSVRELLTWTMQFMSATRKIRNIEFAEICKLTGSYRWENEFIVDVVYEGNSLFVESEDNFICYLLQKKKLTFVPGKYFTHSVFTNANVEFFINKDSQNYEMYIRPRVGRSIIMTRV